MSDSYESVEEVEDEVLDDQEESQEEVQQEEKPKHRSNHIDFKSLPPDIVEKVRPRIDEDFRKIKDYERQTKDAQRRIRELEDQILETKKPKEVQMPSADLAITDPEEFTRRQSAFSESIRATAQYEYEQQQRQALLKQEQQREANEQVRDFEERAKSSGVDVGQAAMAAQIAMQSLPQELHGFLAMHDQAPQLLVRLASNPTEMQELATLSPVEAAVKLDRMAQSFKKSTKSKAPPPDEPLKGGAVPKKDQYGGLLEGGGIV